MTPLGLIFDFDGTLVDSMPAHFAAWTEACQPHGIHFPEERFYLLGGIPTHQILEMLKVEQQLDFDSALVARQKEEGYFRRLNLVTRIEPVIEIARAHRGKIPLAIATGGRHHVINAVIDLLDLNGWFDAIVTSEDVTRQKPAPDIFLEAARRIQVEPRFCRGFEDTGIGMQAIRDAGMDAVDVRELLAAHR
ncbi:MAG: HAD family hydrolase [Pedosphaera sp.]|nr:HAD family hydrolase [Pedosphaera sp.]